MTGRTILGAPECLQTGRTLAPELGEPRKACELPGGRAIQIYKSKLPCLGSYELLGSDLEGLRATRKRSGGPASC